MRACRGAAEERRQPGNAPSAGTRADVLETPIDDRVVQVLVLVRRPVIIALEDADLGPAGRRPVAHPASESRRRQPERASEPDDRSEKGTHSSCGLGGGGSRGGPALADGPNSRCLPRATAERGGAMMSVGFMSGKSTSSSSESSMAIGPWLAVATALRRHAQGAGCQLPGDLLKRLGRVGAPGLHWFGAAGRRLLRARCRRRLLDALQDLSRDRLAVETGQSSARPGSKVGRMGRA
jgi:hypothetical protein